MPVGGMLGMVGQMARQTNLIKEITTSMPIWRVRVHSNIKILRNDFEFASQPIHHVTQPNRMSPSGVSMFYGVEDWQTACRETVDPWRATGHRVTGGRFLTKRTLKVLDLYDLPDIPSFWEHRPAHR